MQCSLFLSLHFVVHGHAVSADGLADVAHGDMAGIDLVGVQVIHRLKLGDEHGVVVVLADVARDLALFELRDHAVERGELRPVERVDVRPVGVDRGGKVISLPDKVVAGEGLEKVTVVGKDTVNGETLINMQTLEAPKTALDIALGQLANFINKWGTIAAIIAFVTMTVSGIMQIGVEKANAFIRLKDALCIV